MMGKSLLLLIVGLVCGLVIAALRPTAPDFDDTSASARFAALEREIAELRRSRSQLSSELGALKREVTEIRADREAAESAVPGSHGALAREELTATETVSIASDARPNRRRGAVEPLADRLIAAGFAADRAAWIERRTDELRIEAMQDRYEAAREGRESRRFAGFATIDATLREELGDAEYEQYLTATGRPTRIAVGEVLASSAAEEAGIRSGDEIVSYAGNRVFSTRDLNHLQLEGEPAEPVLVEIIRDGNPVQLVLPRGPLGITPGRAQRTLSLPSR